MKVNKVHLYEGKVLTGTKCTIPDELGSNTECTRNTKEDSVEVHLVETIVGKKDTGVGINIGPWILRFAGLEEG